MDTQKETSKENFGTRPTPPSGREGKATKAIEQVTSTLPSDLWLVAAGLSIAGSIAMKVIGRDIGANFVGQWAPVFLLLGVYNKIVKVAGSERNRAMS